MNDTEQTAKRPVRCAAVCESTVAFPPGRVGPLVDLPSDVRCARETGHAGHHFGDITHDGYPTKVGW